MVEEIDKDPEEGGESIEIDGEKFKADPDNEGEALKDDDGDPIPFEDQSRETDKPVTAEDAMQLARNLQKGYTINRQDMATIRENQEKIQESLVKLQKAKDDDESGGFGGGDEDEEKPLTVKGYLALQKQQRESAGKETEKLNLKIDRDITELKAQGIVKNDKEAETLLKYAVKHEITNLFKAAERMAEVEEARQVGRKEGAKGKVKEEAGGKIGTSGKTKTGEGEKGFDYEEIHTKDMEDLAEE